MAQRGVLDHSRMERECLFWSRNFGLTENESHPASEHGGGRSRQSGRAIESVSHDAE